jgi:GxxExxY protein
MIDLNQLSSKIIKAAINVHKALGPGLLESVYQACLIIELEEMTIKTEQEVLLPIMYLDPKVHDEEFRMDLLVEDAVIVSSNVLYNSFEVPLHRKVV